jgi:hypothetical protein
MGDRRNYVRLRYPLRPDLRPSRTWGCLRGSAKRDSSGSRIGVVQKLVVPGYTENRQSRTRKGIPRFECYPVLNHAVSGQGKSLRKIREITALGRRG